MPQDTIRTGLNPGDFIVLPDTAPAALKSYLHQQAREKGYEKKPHNFSDWVPLFYTIGILALIWIIIRIRDGKSKSYVAFGSLVNNEADYDIFEKDESQDKKPDTKKDPS